MAKYKGTKPKYTEAELRARHIETYTPVNDAIHEGRWMIKKATYITEGIHECYMSLRRSFQVLFTMSNGFKDTEEANIASQMMIDAFLIRRTKGENVEPPKEVVPVNAVSGDEIIELLDPADFTDKNVSENEKLRWIFENIKTDGIEKADAPSIGAYAMLHRLRENKDQLRDFDKTLWPKLLAKEDADKVGKLEDTGKDTIELIDRLIKAEEEKV